MRAGLIVAMVVALSFFVAAVLLAPPRHAEPGDTLVIHVYTPGAEPGSAPSNFVYPPDSADDLSRILPTEIPQTDLLDQIPWLTAAQREEIRAGNMYFL